MRPTEVFTMSQIKVLLVGGLPSFPSEERVQFTESLSEKIKYRFGANYEHFVHEGEHTTLDGEKLPVFQWMTRKRLPRTVQHRAHQTPQPDRDPDPLPVHRDVREHTGGKAVDLPRRRPAGRARHRAAPRPCGHQDHLTPVRHVLHHQRGQTREHNPDNGSDGPRPGPRP
jgi:hypothetical protein